MKNLASGFNREASSEEVKNLRAKTLHLKDV